MAIDNTLNVEVVASVDGLKKGLTQAEKGIKGFSNETNRAVATTNKMGTAVQANAVPALTSFSQVIQDAPYGIRGVANNITQLTSQFGYLSKSTGGAKSAIKAMIGSLAGPAGILFAVSAVTSLLVSYGDELFKSSKETDNATLATERLNDSLRSQLEIRKLLKDELSLATKIAVAEAKLSGASEAEQFKVVEKFSKARIATLEGQVDEQIKLWKEASAAAKLAANQENEEIQKAAKDAFKTKIDLEKNLKDALAELRLAQLNEQLRIQNQEKKNAGEFTTEVKAIFTKFNTELTPIIAKTNEVIGNIIPTSKLTEKQRFLISSLVDFNKQADNLIQNSIASTFSNLGTAIGEAIAQGTNVFSAAGQAILSGIGGFLSDLGKLMIQYGTAALLYSEASKALLNPLTAGPAAAALIAAGVVLSTIGSAIRGAVGSSGSTSSDYASDTSNTSFVGSRTSFSNDSGGRYVFEIQGTKLVGVLQNTLARNKSFGGNLQIG